MGFLSRFRNQPVADPTPEQAVIVRLKLSDDEFGTEAERHVVLDLGDIFRSAVAGFGEYDGHEFGEGWAVLYFYGQDADRLAEAVTPVIQAMNPPAGSFLIRRRGGPDAPRSAETRQELGP